MPNEPGQPPMVEKSWKSRLGLGLLVYSFVPLITVELLALLPLTATQAVTLGAVYVGSGEIAFLAAAALLGKPFIKAVKDKLVERFFPGKAPGRGAPIGRARHAFGLALLLGSLAPYYGAIAVLLFGHEKDISPKTLLYLLLSGEGLFVVGLLVLGEEFWARLKHLFEWPGKER